MTVDLPKFETQDDCLAAIALRTIDQLPENWTYAGIDGVRLGEREFTSRAYYIEAGADKRRSLHLDDDVIDMFFSLAYLTSTEAKGFYKKVQFTLARDGAGTRYHTTFDYDDTSEGFIGSNGVLIDGEFFKKKGPPPAI